MYNTSSKPSIISREHRKFINNIISWGDSIPGAGFEIIYHKAYIPIYLLDPKDMPTSGGCTDPNFRNDSPKDDRNRRSDSPEDDHIFKPGSQSMPGFEWLGFYQRSTPIYHLATPTIGLCPERIHRCADVGGFDFNTLLAKVVIHEFAHARMDRRRLRLLYKTTDEFYLWMEESMANCLALKYFEGIQKSADWDGVNRLPCVKRFISLQPDHYKLGLDFYDHGLDGYWEPWREKKYNGLQNFSAQRDWLHYVKANVGKTDRKILHDLTAALYTP